LVENHSTNGHSALDRKHLIWLACVFAALVSVNVFFYTESMAYTKDKCVTMQREMDLRYSDIRENLRLILSEIKDLRGAKH